MCVLVVVIVMIIVVCFVIVRLFMAPEVIEGNKYDEKADIWSTGVLIFQVDFFGQYILYFFVLIHICLSAC
jgi:serine/threonine protein kinase